MPADRIRACLLLLACSCAVLVPASAGAGSPPVGEITIGRLARLQQQVLEQETAKRLASAMAQASGSAPAAAPPAPAPLRWGLPKPQRSVTLLGLVSVNGAVRHAELLHDGMVVTARTGAWLAGWRLTRLTPEEVLLVRGRTSVALKPGESVEGR